jgi:hypothetical protein
MINFFSGSGACFGFAAALRLFLTHRDEISENNVREIRRERDRSHRAFRLSPPFDRQIFREVLGFNAFSTLYCCTHSS